MLIICLALWNCVMIPFDIAFSPAVSHTPSFTKITKADYFVIADIIIAGFFFLDIVIQFITTFYNNEGGEVYDKRIIARRYICGGRFMIDILATVPFDQLAGNSVAFKLFGLLKLVRITRLTQIIANL